jgi:hypothetical protein
MSKVPATTRLHPETVDNINLIARHKGVSGAQVIRWAVDEFIGAHAVELSNVLRPTANSSGVVELSNSTEEGQTDKDLADQWDREYGRR